jgi:hypothetical protein
MGALMLNGVLCNAISSGFIAMDMSLGLWMAQFLEGQQENHSFFAIQEEGTKFGFCGGRNNESEDGAKGKKCTIQFDGVTIFQGPSHKEMTASPTTSIRF